MKAKLLSTAIGCVLQTRSGSNSGSNSVSTMVVVNDEGVADICGKEEPFNVDGPAYRVTRKYYINKGSPDFHRMVVFMEGMFTNHTVLMT